MQAPRACTPTTAISCRGQTEVGKRSHLTVSEHAIAARQPGKPGGATWSLDAFKSVHERPSCGFPGGGGASACTPPGKMTETGGASRAAARSHRALDGMSGGIREADRPDPWLEPPAAEAGVASLQLAAGLSVAPGQLLMMLAPGDAMSPTILEASPMIIQRGARPERDGAGLYVLRFGGGFTTVRRVARALAEPNTWRLISDDTAYREERISDADLAETACLGRVVFVAPQ